MSEKKETIEERFEDIRRASRKRRFLGDFFTSDAMTLLDDLMAERGKLKERVEELERKQATHEISAVYCPNSQELELTWEDCQSGKKEHLLVVVPDDKGEAIADIVPPCVYSPAVIKED